MSHTLTLSHLCGVPGTASPIFSPFDLYIPGFSFHFILTLIPRNDDTDGPQSILTSPVMGEPQIPFPSVIDTQPSLVSSVPLVVSELMAEAVLSQSSAVNNVAVEGPAQPGAPPNRDALLFLLPLLIVLSTFLFLILLFLVFVILLRRRRGIRLRDGEGPIDLSREDIIEGEGGLEGVESRWLESVIESERRTYLRAKGTPVVNNSATCTLKSD